MKIEIDFIKSLYFITNSDDVIWLHPQEIIKENRKSFLLFEGPDFQNN